jgi:hypothetical protein
MTDRQTLITGFLRDCGWDDANLTLLAGDASNRRYDRLTRRDGVTAILMDAPASRGEDVRPFVKIARHLSQQGLSAPAILQEDPANGLLLIEDLGDDLFARLMIRAPDLTRALYEAATDTLIALHRGPTLPLEECTASWLTQMTAPVFEWYVQGDPQSSLAAFDASFRPLFDTLDTADRVIILRDYHAENLLWLPQRDGVARVGLLDFQDALLGHRAYDLVSVLQDARRDVSPEIERMMIDRYIARTECDAEAFRRAYALLGAQRNLRIIGIFARLCLRDGKLHYVEKIPRVWAYVRRNLAHPSLVPVASVVLSALPEPTPAYLEHLRSRCATLPTP